MREKKDGSRDNSFAFPVLRRLVRAAQKYPTHSRIRALFLVGKNEKLVLEAYSKYTYVLILDLFWIVLAAGKKKFRSHGSNSCHGSDPSHFSNSSRSFPAEPHRDS